MGNTCASGSEKVKEASKKKDIPTFSPVFATLSPEKEAAVIAEILKDKQCCSGHNTVAAKWEKEAKWEDVECVDVNGGTIPVRHQDIKCIDVDGGGRVRYQVIQCQVTEMLGSCCNKDGSILQVEKENNPSLLQQEPSISVTSSEEPYELRVL